MLENKVGKTGFKAKRARATAHPIEEVGERLRAMMPWIAERRMVDKEKNQGPQDHRFGRGILE